MALSKETKDMADDLMRQLKEPQDANKQHEPAYVLLNDLVTWDRRFPVGDSTGNGLVELNKIIERAAHILKARTLGLPIAKVEADL